MARRSTGKINLKSLLLILPQIILFLIIIKSILNSVILSLNVSDNNSIFNNYKKLFEREDFISSLSFTLKYTFLSSLLAVIIALIIVEFLSDRESKIGDFIMNIPVMIPHFVVCVFLTILFSKTGLLSRILSYTNINLNLVDKILYNQNALGIILSFLWKEIPFIIIFSIVIYRKINTNLCEASRNLGASRLHTFLKIKLPLIFPTVYIAFMIIFAYAFSNYEVPLLLGPNIPKSLSELSYLEYSKPDLINRNYAMAINTIILLIVFILVLIYLIFIRRSSRRNDL